ncbi:hypothetical protein [Arthrobacter sp. UYCo732]|uniref:hypothetical protein n=1 Tax=Arthrobacter sp. UYCo732 TaxID=3156336 RepID=UPI0033968AA9
MSAAFEAAVAFPNGLLWLMADEGRHLDIPDVDGVANFWTSPNAWGVAVLHDADGKVNVTVGAGRPDDPELILLHDGVLHSRRRLIEIQTVYLDGVARIHTSAEDIAVVIWGDDPGQPERLHIQCWDFVGEVAA